MGSKYNDILHEQRLKNKKELKHADLLRLTTIKKVKIYVEEIKMPKFFNQGIKKKNY